MRSRALWAALALTAIVSSIVLSKNIDFAPYWYGVGGFLDGSRPLYGPSSGVGYPQEFRYPPVTVLFFAPLTKIPFRVAGLLLDLIAWAICAWTAMVAIRRWKLRFSSGGALLAAVLAGPYVYLAVKFGNVQPILTALVLLALLWAEERPAAGGIVLAFAICFKVWPLFFVLWFLIPSRWRALCWAAASSAILWTVPVLYFGFTRYIDLVRDFYTHASSLASNPEQLWYAGQSLRGVLLRFLTNTVPVPADYPNLSFASLPRALVVDAWIGLSVIATLAAVFAMWRASLGERYLWDAMGFVLCAALQPFSFNSTLILLGPAILVGGHVYSTSSSARARSSFLVASVLSGVGASMFTRAMVHANLMWGIHFWIMLALALSLATAGAGSKAKEN